MNISEQTRIEASIGFVAGILVSLLATLVIVLFFTEMVWYWKTFTVIGLVGMIGTQVLAIDQLWKARTAYLLAVQWSKDQHKEVTNNPPM